MKGSLLAAAVIAALAAPDAAVIEDLRRLHAEGEPWAELGRALIAAEETGAAPSEALELRRDGLDWERVARQLRLRELGRRQDRIVVPEAQDQELWQRGGFATPGSRRRRAPGQPGTVKPPDAILPPGGHRPLIYDEHAPVRPVLPE